MRESRGGTKSEIGQGPGTAGRESPPSKDGGYRGLVVSKVNHFFVGREDRPLKRSATGDG